MKSDKANEIYSIYNEVGHQAERAIDLLYKRFAVLVPLIVKDVDRREALVKTIDEFYKEASLDVRGIALDGYRVASKIDEELTGVGKPSTENDVIG